MIVLGIETSCDETAAAVVKDGKKILSNVIASSSKMHSKSGGIIPEQAARAQLQSIIPVIEKAIADSLPSSDYNKKKAVGRRQLEADHVDAIAVTYGPGLIGSLLVGVETAKTLSFLWEKPIIPVNHLIAHIYANFTDDKPKIKGEKSKVIRFPLIALVVSGGHTDLVLMKNHGKIKWIGGTRDDAAGEAFDKCARVLGLPYPGGPSISASAEKFQIPNSKFQMNMFPRPMIGSANFDFSFSGLKTSVLNRAEEQENLRVKDRIKTPQLAAEVQEAIVDSLIAKSIRSIEKYNPKSFLLSGGVAANKQLRDKLRKKLEMQNDLEFHVPPPALCTDNAAMIATAAFYNYRPLPWKKVVANSQLTIARET